MLQGGVGDDGFETWRGRPHDVTAYPPDRCGGKPGPCALEDGRVDVGCGHVRYPLSQASGDESVAAPNVENAPGAERNLGLQ